MSNFTLKPAHAPVKAYYAALAQFHLHGHKTEGNTRSAFADLLKVCCSPVEEHQPKGSGFANSISNTSAGAGPLRPHH